MVPTEFISLLGRGKPGPAYFFRGSDRFLHEECRAAIVASLPRDLREWCLAEIEYQPGRLARELEGASQMPMLGGHSFLVFSDPEDFKHASDPDYGALQSYLDRPSSFATVVFVAAEPDRRRRFIQLLEKKTQVVEMLPLSGREAITWLRGHLQKARVEIDPELAQEIVARFETTPDAPDEAKRPGVNLLWLRTELEKLLTARPGVKHLERTDLDLMVVFREEHEIGKLLAAVAERQFGEALFQLRSLLASKEPETLLLWYIGDLFRQALKSSSQPQYARAGWGRRANPFSTFAIAPRAARNYSRQELAQALRLVRRADLGIKSSWKDSRILLEFLIWQIIAGKTAERLTDSEIPAPAAEV